MRLSYNWLRELLPDLTLAPKELAELLTAHSFETNVTEEYGVPAGIKTVKITKIEKHPNADRLRLATITAGINEITVVCGAPNIEVGQIVPYSPPGVELKDENGVAVIIKRSKIRGVESPGMLNSLNELGLYKDHSGIWVLPADTPVGQELSGLIPRDTILEADITPNRAHDCLSHVGVAREIAALLHIPITEPVLADMPTREQTVEGYTVTIEDPRLSPRFLAAVVDGLTITASPLNIQAKILSAGGKPINNLVDVTNYVLFEYGNPTHLYDRALLPGKKLGVRRAKDKEPFITLDDVEHALTSEDLVVTANDTPVSLAGVRGGKNSSIQPTTKQGLLEVANFSPFAIQETARRQTVRTDSSTRFSKGLDPNLVEVAARRLIRLLQETAGATIKGVIDVYPKPVGERIIDFRPARVSKIAGSDIYDEKHSHSVLTFLRCKIDDSKVPWRVTVPTDRLDLEGEHDLVEEIIRVTGLTKIEPNLAIRQPGGPAEMAGKLPAVIYWREVTRDTLVELGLTETLNYSFEPEAFAKLAGIEKNKHLELTNPPAPDLKNMRLQLLPGLLGNLERNREAFHRRPVGLFEIGHVYAPALPAVALREGGRASRVPGVIETIHLAAVIPGDAPSLEQISQKIAEALSIDAPLFKNIITPKMISELKYRLPVVGFEINVNELVMSVEKAVPTARTLEEIQAEPFIPTAFTPLPKYPSVFRDISMLVETSVTVEQAQEIIERTGGNLVVDVDLFDEFEPKGKDQKSLAFHIEYRADDRTLTDAEINPLHACIIAQLEAELSAEIR